MQPITLRKALPQDALCLAALGIQVFLDTYATEGIRDAIAQEALDAFSPDNLSKVIARPDTFITLAEIDGHLDNARPRALIQQQIASLISGFLAQSFNN
ncbi:hypothetical protein DA83_24315 [Pseudomonas sp. 250J]|nr:hypothetical protein DA83_24315 [Pseudomonas sp. 250J]QZA52155.1 hypothetical protein K2O50_14030 [Pseudomonas sp. 2hn]